MPCDGDGGVLERAYEGLEKKDPLVKENLFVGVESKENLDGDNR